LEETAKDHTSTDRTHVQLVGVSIGFARPDAPEPEQVLYSIDLQVKRGESVAVVGPSGSGKTTVLNLIGGLLIPDAGSVLVDGVSIHELNPDERAQFRRTNIGFIFQNHRLLPQLTALENTLLPCIVDGLSGAERDQRVARAMELLKRLEINHRAEHSPGQMSLGQCQRVAVARALIRSPGLILADEPTGSLDRAQSEQLVDQLLEIQRNQNTTLVVVTHNPDIAQRMDRQLSLSDHKILRS
jgi:lipoprotein-releasing system ATP-binding protein